MSFPNSIFTSGANGVSNIPTGSTPTTAGEIDDATNPNQIYSSFASGSKRLKTTNSTMTAAGDLGCVNATALNFNAIGKYKGQFYVDSSETHGFDLLSSTKMLNPEFQGVDTAMLTVSASGDIRKTSATMSTAGLLDCVSINTQSIRSDNVRTNNITNTNANASIQLNNSSFGAVTFTGTKYLGNNNAIISVTGSGLIEANSSNARVDNFGNIDSKNLSSTDGDIEVVTNTNSFIGETHRVKNPSSGSLKLLNKYGTGASASKGIEIDNSTQANIKFTGDTYLGVNTAILTVTGSGDIRKSAATMSDLGALNCLGVTVQNDLVANNVQSDNYYNKNGSARIQLDTSAVGDVTFTGSAYSLPINNGRVLSLQSGKIVPIPASAGGSSFTNVTGFQLRQSGTASPISSSNSVYAHKVGDYISLQIPLMPVTTGASANSIISNICTLTDILPLSFMTSPVLVDSSLAGAVFTSDANDQKISINKLGGGSWTATSNNVFPLVIQYRCVNSTPLNNGTSVFGAALVPEPYPDLFATPTNLTTNTSNANWIVSNSEPAEYPAYRLFDNALDFPNLWNSKNTYVTGSGVAGGTDTFNTGSATVQGAFAKITFDQIYNYNQYQLYVATNTAGNNPLDWSIYGSTDQANYTLIETRSNAVLNAAAYTVFNLATTVSYRDFVIVVTKTNGANFMVIIEMKISKV
jgi:hypothetical protein